MRAARQTAYLFNGLQKTLPRRRELLNRLASASDQFGNGERESGRGTGWISSGGASGGASPRGLP